MTEYPAKLPGPRKDQTAYIPRATQRFLGWPALERDLVSAPALTHVRLEDTASRVILGLLDSPGHHRSGALFGTRVGTVAHIADASHAGYPQFRHNLACQPLAVDPQYLLGWSDCLSMYGTNDVDWLGHWMIRPDNLIGDALDHYGWLRQAHRLGLVDRQHFFMFVGLDAEQVAYHAYVYLNDESTALPVLLT